jgi:hypothetical protein
MPRPHEAVSAPKPYAETVFHVNSKTCSGADFFLSAEFLRKYRAEPWRYPFARPPMAPGDLRAALLHAADCLEAGLDAQVDGDEAELLRNLETVRGVVAVVIEQISGSSEQHLVH